MDLQGVASLSHIGRPATGRFRPLGRNVRHLTLLKFSDQPFDGHDVERLWLRGDTEAALITAPSVCLVMTRETVRPAPLVAFARYLPLSHPDYAKAARDWIDQGCLSGAS